MKILIVQDSAGWAIGQLSNVIVKFNKHHRIEILTIHPKELRSNPEPHEDDFLAKIEEFKPDLIHFQYWDLANRLHHLTDIPMVLTHHNQRNLLSCDWSKMQTIIVHTKKAKQILDDAGYKNVVVIQHGIDIEKFKYNDKYDVKNNTLGYCGRIVPWKGLYEILKVAKELGTKVIMMGKPDKPDYWEKCQEFKDQMDLRFNTPNEEQVKVYHEMGVYVGNSRDGVEEGTLPLLEAMACGVPVVTTLSGEANDIIKDGDNGIAVDFEDYESLAGGIINMLEKADRNKLRDNAWNTVRNLNDERMARNYEKMYYNTLYNKDLVSVIIPTCNRQDSIEKVLDGYSMQTYKPIELIIVIDDWVGDSIQKYWKIVDDWKHKNPEIPVKVLETGNDGYGLAMARNMGTIEAVGHYLIFSDDRFCPNTDAVEWFTKALSGIKTNAVVFGDKGANKKTFVENFFIIRKQHFVNSGMFLERITEYGGMSQEFRERLSHQGFSIVYESKAKATTLFGTHNRSNKRYQLYRMKKLLWKLRG